MFTLQLLGEEEIELIRRMINLVIGYNVLELVSELELSNSFLLLIQTELLKITYYTYLWLYLTFEVIRSSIGLIKNKLQEIISTLFKKVKDAYKAILDKSKDKIRIKKLLCIVVSAIRPLTLKEMSITLTVESYHRLYNKLDLKKEGKQKEIIRNLYSLFVIIIDGKVYSIHQPVKEFLIGDNIKLNPSRFEIQKQPLIPRKSNLVIIKSYIWYLLFIIFKSNPPLTNPYSVKMNGFKAMRSFLDYAALHWVYQFRKAEPIEDITFLELALAVCDARFKRCRTWRRICGEATSI